MSTKISKIKVLSFVPYQDVVDTEMMWVLRRNEVKLEGSRVVETDVFNSKLKQSNRVFGDLVEEMYDFCNDSCKGIWTYTHTTEFKDQLEPVASYHGIHQILMTGTMRVYFEMREDRDMFMKNHVLLKKLTQE